MLSKLVTPGVLQMPRWIGQDVEQDGRGTAHQVGWDVDLHAACVGRRRRKLCPDVCCLWSADGHASGCGSKHALGAGAGGASGQTPPSDIQALVALFWKLTKKKTAVITNVKWTFSSRASSRPVHDEN
jgi:hypothetical protein